MSETIQTKPALTMDRRGVTAVEYGIMAALIATALVTSVGYITTGLSTAFTNIQTHLASGT